MADNLFETYNPLYDVHLRQYFASPHMQKHLRDIGLIQPSNEKQAESVSYARHQIMMEMLMRNRERVLKQLADIHKKLDAAEKVEIYRKIRSGLTSVEEERRIHASRSLSRPSRGRTKKASTERRQRRHSNSFDDSEVIKRVEADYKSDSEALKHPKDIYARLAANVYKYQYLHKLDDKTLARYKESLQKQLQKLERFRELTFGSNSVARHQPVNSQSSWFFRRRSLPSLIETSAPPLNKTHQPLRSSKTQRKSRAGKSSSPRKVSASEGPEKMRNTMSRSRVPPQHRLPPLPKRMAPPKAISKPSAPKIPPMKTSKPPTTVKKSILPASGKSLSTNTMSTKNERPVVHNVVDNLNAEVDKQSEISHSPVSSITHEDLVRDRGFDSERGYSSTGGSTYAESISDMEANSTAETKLTPEQFLEENDHIENYLKLDIGSTTTLTQLPNNDNYATNDTEDVKRGISLPSNVEPECKLFVDSTEPIQHSNIENENISNGIKHEVEELEQTYENYNYNEELNQPDETFIKNEIVEHLEYEDKNQNLNFKPEEDTFQEDEAEQTYFNSIVKREINNDNESEHANASLENTYSYENQTEQIENFEPEYQPIVEKPISPPINHVIQSPVYRQNGIDVNYNERSTEYLEDEETEDENAKVENTFLEQSVYVPLTDEDMNQNAEFIGSETFHHVSHYVPQSDYQQYDNGVGESYELDQDDEEKASDECYILDNDSNNRPEFDNTEIGEYKEYSNENDHSVLHEEVNEYQNEKLQQQKFNAYIAPEQQQQQIEEAEIGIQHEHVSESTLNVDAEDGYEPRGELANNYVSNNDENMAEIAIRNSSPYNASEQVSNPGLEEVEKQEEQFLDNNDFISNNFENDKDNNYETNNQYNTNDYDYEAQKNKFEQEEQFDSEERAFVLGSEPMEEENRIIESQPEELPTSNDHVESDHFENGASETINDHYSTEEHITDYHNNSMSENEEEQITTRIGQQESEAVITNYESSSYTYDENHTREDEKHNDSPAIDDNNELEADQASVNEDEWRPEETKDKGNDSSIEIHQQTTENYTPVSVNQNEFENNNYALGSTETHQFDDAANDHHLQVTTAVPQNDDFEGSENKEIAIVQEATSFNDNFDKESVKNKLPLEADEYMPEISNGIEHDNSFRSENSNNTESSQLSAKYLDEEKTKLDAENVLLREQEPIGMNSIHNYYNEASDVSYEPTEYDNVNYANITGNEFKNDYAEEKPNGNEAEFYHYNLDNRTERSDVMYNDSNVEGEPIYDSPVDQQSSQIEDETRFSEIHEQYSHTGDFYSEAITEETKPIYGQENQLLFQPSIEITPASDYGGSMEENLDKSDEQEIQPSNVDETSNSNIRSDVTSDELQDSSIQQGYAVDTISNQYETDILQNEAVDESDQLFDGSEEIQARNYSEEYAYKNGNVVHQSTINDDDNENDNEYNEKSSLLSSEHCAKRNGVLATGDCNGSFGSVHDSNNNNGNLNVTNGDYNDDDDEEDSDSIIIYNQKEATISNYEQQQEV